MKPTPSTLVFTATVGKVDINPYVRVPDPVVAQLLQDANRTAGPIPAAGTLQGKPFSATVVKFRELWRLYLNTAMRRDASVEVGDTVVVEIWFDGASRREPMPPKLAAALSRNRRARQTFEKLAPSRRKEILRYLNSLKREETLERNVVKVIRFLLGQKVQGLVAVTRAK